MHMLCLQADSVARVVGYDFLVVMIGEHGFLIPQSNVENLTEILAEGPKSILPTDTRIQQRWFTVSEIHEVFGVPLSTARKDMRNMAEARKIRGKWQIPYVVAIALYANGRQRGLR